MKLHQVAILVALAVSSTSVLSASKNEERIQNKNDCYAHFQNKDYAAAMTSCQEAAKLGDGEAKNLIGAMYEEGLGVKQDYTKAMDYYKDASYDDVPDAFTNIGFLYDQGLGVAKNDQEALYYYEKGQRLGDDNAAINLAGMVAEGRAKGKMSESDVIRILTPVAESGNNLAAVKLAKLYLNKGLYELAIKFYSIAASNNDPLANYQLAHIYLDGVGIPVEKAKGLTYMKKSADLGYVDAEYEYGLSLYNEKNFDQSFSYLIKASEANNILAMPYAGLMLVYGVGVDEDQTKGLNLLQKAANKDNPLANRFLGDIYYDGSKTVKDYEKAFGYYKKGSKLVDAESQYKYARMMFNGEGTKADPLFAIEWFKGAVEKGNVDSMMALADIYMGNNNYGFKDRERAEYYYRMAKDHGNADADYILKHTDFRAIEE